MYDVEGLEKEWKRYRAKRRIPLIVTASAFVLIAGYLLFRVELAKLVSGPQGDQNQSLVQISKKPKEPALSPYVPTMLAQNESNQSQQNSSTIQENNNSSQEDIREKTRPPMSIEVSEADEKASEGHKRKYIKIELTDMYPEKETEDTAAKKRNNRLSIKSVEKSFAKSRSYRDSLYLANAYYKKGNYSKAQKWALITNDLNSKIEESWLIFAKAKAKMGQRKEAEHVLSSYIRKTNSSKAKKVLRKIKKGTI